MSTLGSILLVSVGVILLLATWYLSPQVPRRLHQRLLRRRCKATGTLVLTYDDGPGNELTPALLDLLERRGVHATFFLMGKRALIHSDVVDRIAREGHELGSHGYQHVHGWWSAPWRALEDLVSGYRALTRWAAPRTTFRPPYGKLTLASWWLLSSARRPMAFWTVIGGDVNDRLPDPTVASERVRKEGGGVVLLHDFDRGPKRSDYVLRATEHLLELADRNGLKVRTLGELMRA